MSMCTFLLRGPEPPTTQKAIGGLGWPDATGLVLVGVDVVTVSESLGHSSIEMTLPDAHPSSENKRRAVQCLDGHYWTTSSKSTAQRDSARLLNLHSMRP